MTRGPRAQKERRKNVDSSTNFTPPYREVIPIRTAPNLFYWWRRVIYFVIACCPVAFWVTHRFGLVQIGLILWIHIRFLERVLRK